MKILDLLFGKREMDVTGDTNNSSNSVPTQPMVVSGDFEFTVEDVFTITGRGTVVTGRVNRGTININEEVLITRNNVKTVVTGIEMFRKQLDSAIEGDNCGLLLRGVSRDQVERGDIIVK